MQNLIYKSSYLSKLNSNNQRHWVIDYYNGRFTMSVPFYMMPFSIKKEMVKQGFNANRNK
jgi:hypothetical protein